MIIRITEHAITRARQRFKLRGSRLEIEYCILSKFLKAKYINTHYETKRRVFKKENWLFIVDDKPKFYTIVTVIKRDKFENLCNNLE
jgi:hypothetical protein